MTQKDIEEGKTLAIISYLTIFGTIIALFMNNEKQSNFTAFILASRGQSIQGKE